eukprot:GHVT01069338.1.p2 GENE.GHVT01069338.1~~GHVT01069338.1.p2  ORF type:complete len:371 (-),score=102.97 GHVT01069338.1:427-1380(-)
MVKEWLGATVIPHDLWNVSIWADPAKGSFEHVAKNDQGKRQIVTLSREDPETKKEAEAKDQAYTVSNYFSFGVESEIGVRFDKRRTRSAWRNQILYGAMWLRSLLRKRPHFERVVDRVEAGTVRYDNNQRVVDYKTAFVSDPTNKSFPSLQRVATLALVNIPAMASGVDMWGPSRRFGLRAPPGGGSQTFDVEARETMEAVQRMGDNRVEWIGLRSRRALAAMIIKHRLDKKYRKAARLLQGYGPWRVYFTPDSGSVAYQVDGEFFLAHNPTLIEIAKFRTIKVLAYRGEHEAQQQKQQEKQQEKQEKPAAAAKAAN